LNFNIIFSKDFELKRVVILFSGNGSNMKKIIENLSDKIDIVAGITDKSEALGLEICKEANIKTYILQNKEFNNELIEIVRSLDIELVICAGFMRILSEKFVNEFTSINIHPSLLPRHRGLKAIEKSYKDCYSDAGITIHYVDRGVDTGKIISQHSIKKIDGELLDSFEERIHNLEYRFYSEAIAKVLSL
jgi:phosphoribosylglycinamide formyltransferase-1